MTEWDVGTRVITTTDPEAFSDPEIYGGQAGVIVATNESTMRPKFYVVMDNPNLHDRTHLQQECCLFEQQRLVLENFVINEEPDVMSLLEHHA